MDEVIGILMNDKQLKSLVSGIYPFGEGSTVSECIVYEFYTASDNGIKATDVLMIDAIGFSIGKALAIIERVKDLLLTLGDEKLTNKVLKVEQNGGGSLKNVVGNKTLYYQKATFNITRRVNR